MRVAIVGGGLVGLALARILGRRGISATVLERLPADVYGPRPFVLSYHGFDALEAAGVGERVRGLRSRPAAAPTAARSGSRSTSSRSAARWPTACRWATSAPSAA